MEKYLKVLKKCPLFYGVKDEELLKMLGCLDARVMEFDKKYTVIAEGCAAKYIGIVLSGSVQVVRVDYYGNRSILTELTTSELFGEAFACAEVNSVPISVIANEPCEVMLINCSHILNDCKTRCAFHQQMIYNLMRDLAKKTITFHQKLEIVSQRTTRDKLLTYLTMYAQKEGKNEFNIPFDRQELADFLEVERSGLSVEISKLKKEGLIDSEKNYIALL